MNYYFQDLETRYKKDPQQTISDLGVYRNEALAQFNHASASSQKEFAEILKLNPELAERFAPLVADNMQNLVESPAGALLVHAIGTENPEALEIITPQLADNFTEFVQHLSEIQIDYLENNPLRFINQLYKKILDTAAQSKEQTYTMMLNSIANNFTYNIDNLSFLNVLEETITSHPKLKNEMIEAIAKHLPTYLNNTRNFHVDIAITSICENIRAQNYLLEAIKKYPEIIIKTKHGAQAIIGIINQRPRKSAATFRNILSDNILDFAKHTPNASKALHEVIVHSPQSELHPFKKALTLGNIDTLVTTYAGSKVLDKLARVSPETAKKVAETFAYNPYVLIAFLRNYYNAYSIVISMIDMNADVAKILKPAVQKVEHLITNSLDRRIIDKIEKETTLYKKALKNIGNIGNIL